MLSLKRAPRADAAVVAPALSLPSADREAAELMIVLDAVGGVLQAYAQHVFDTDLQPRGETRALLQQWRMHALIGAVPPSGADEARGATIADRDWHGLLRHFAETRRDEVAFVGRSHGELRASLWAFVSSIHRLVRAEHDEGGELQTHLDRVKAAAAGTDSDVLRQEAVAAVAAMELLVTRRRARQKEEFSALADRLKDLTREIDESRRESGIDALTGLSNRKEFDVYVRQCLELSTITGRSACLLMVDVDDFKRINDTHGHALGDEALCQVAKALSRTILRKIDFVCRFGGDEFAIILHETDASSAQLIGNKIRRALRDVLDTPRANEQDLDYTLSIGVAELVIGDDPLSWISRADEAMYEAKKGGRNRVAIASRS